MNRICCLFLAGFFCITQSNAQQVLLTREQMLEGAPQLVTQPLPVFAGWLDDYHFLLTKQSVTYRINAKTLKQERYEEAEEKASATAEVFVSNGDVYLSYGDATSRRLTQTVAAERNPTLSPDQKWVAFTRENNLFIINLLTNTESQLTFDGSTTVLNGYASWVYYEEILGRPSNYRSFWWSPDSKRIAFMRMDESKVPLFPIVSEAGVHGAVEETRYPKAGDPNPEVKIGVINLEDRSTVWADFDAKTDQYFGLPYWTPQSDALWIQWMPRSQDSLLIYQMNLNDGSKKEIFRETQKTWVDLDDQGERIHFLKDKLHFIYKSDESGRKHLYLHEMTGRRKHAITEGDYDVAEVLHIDERKKCLYFTARKENSTRYDLYKATLDGKQLQRLTFGNYTHEDIHLSPDASYFLTTYSNVAEPEVMALVNNKGKKIIELGSAKGSVFDNTIIARTSLLRVRSEDGKYALPVRILWPVSYDKAKKYPLLINIYGGPNAGTVYDGWDFNRMQQWWATEGLIQVSMDHRGSGHFGKAGMNELHRNLGYWEMKDWTTIVKWLIDSAGVDPERVCINGFSYGGYLTCYALTYGADVFTHGMAGGSVTDWLLYDTHYTERYMDHPLENPEGYRNASVLTHVSNYKGMLRLYHGTMDDNVHLQNSLQLAKKLQEQQKHFELMLYPGGRHGWRNLYGQDTHSKQENMRFIYHYLLRKSMQLD